MKSWVIGLVIFWMYLIGGCKGQFLHDNKSQNDAFWRHTYPKVCQPGLYQGPNNKFAIYLFCDDAAGTTIGVINTSPGGYAGPGAEKVWQMQARFWQDARWSRDVDYVEWSKQGDKLTIRTGSVYGTDKTYTLDLIHKRIEKENDNVVLVK